MRSHLLDEAKRLTIQERIDLVEAIWDSVSEDAGVDQVPVPEWHRAELDRHIEDMEANPDAGSSWEEVKKRLERPR